MQLTLEAGLYNIRRWSAVRNFAVKYIEATHKNAMHRSILTHHHINTTFGFEKSESQHTEVLTALCFLFLLSAYFYWIINPRLKRKQQG